jgi:hypothetical protein
VAGVGHLRVVLAVDAASLRHALWIAPKPALAVPLILCDHPDEALGVGSLTRLQIRKRATGSLHKVWLAGIDMNGH